jgi:penicillin-binding protein 1A
VYQTALDMGYNPATPLTDLARTFKYNYKGETKIWSPQNYERNFKGFIPLREALVHSRNLATINLVADLGVDTIRKRLAFLDVPHIPKDMSIALGNLGLSPLKMAQIFSVFANDGHMIEPRLVSKIISKEGAVIYETRPKEIADFTTPEQAYLMTNILKDVVRRGTGKNAKVKEIMLAGKTGTTNQGIDAWFCGYSPTIETIVWIGRDNNKPIGKGATGGALAAPAFAYYYRKLLELYPATKREFDVPVGVSVGEYEGKTELFTENSPLPVKNKKMVNPYESILNEGDEENSVDINLSQDPELAETLKIEEERVETRDPDDEALHPRRKVPIRPATEDSGDLF